MAAKPKGATGDNRGGSGGKRESTRYEGLGRATSDRAALWSLVESDLLARMVGLITAVGDAVTFSCTRDGGAGCICVLTEGRQIKVYGSDPDELNELMRVTCDGLQEEVMSGQS